jgi:hypothetical protein
MVHVVYRQQVYNAESEYKYWHVITLLYQVWGLKLC